MWGSLHDVIAETSGVRVPLEYASRSACIHSCLEYLQSHLSSLLQSVKGLEIFRMYPRD